MNCILARGCTIAPRHRKSTHFYFLEQKDITALSGIPVRSLFVLHEGVLVLHQQGSMQFTQQAEQIPCIQAIVHGFFFRREEYLASQRKKKFIFNGVCHDKTIMNGSRTNRVHKNVTGIIVFSRSRSRSRKGRLCLCLCLCLCWCLSGGQHIANVSQQGVKAHHQLVIYKYTHRHRQVYIMTDTNP